MSRWHSPFSDIGVGTAINKDNPLFKTLKKADEKDFQKLSSSYLVDLLIKYKKDLDGVHIMTAGDLKVASKLSEKI